MMRKFDYQNLARGVKKVDTKKTDNENALMADDENQVSIFDFSQEQELL